MTMKMVFNERSLTPARAKDSRLAAAWMRELIGVLKAAKEIACGGSFVVLTSPEFKQMEVMRNYYVGEWLCDVDYETRTAFLAFFAVFKFIAVHDLHVEFKLHNKCPVIGLGIAHLESCIAVSLPSRPRWTEHSEITLHGYELDENGDLMPPVIYLVRHASTAVHMQRFALVWRQSDKHRPGGQGTNMLLSADAAQKILNCSVQVEGESQRYGYENGTLYEFQDDNAGSFHGYPITVQDLREAGKHQAVLGLLRDAGRMSESDYKTLIN
jgi:hypothetical protein